MNKLIRVLVSLTVVSALLMSVGCGQSKTKDVATSTVTEVAKTVEEKKVEEKKIEEKKPFTVTYFTSQSRLKEAQKKMGEAIKNDEGITVDFQVAPDPQFQNLVMTKLAASELPDILDVNIPETYETFKAVDNYLDVTSEAWASRVVNPKLITNPKDGKIYGVPKYANAAAMGLIINKKVFSDLGLSVPKTYAEFLALLESVKTSGKDITPFYMSNKDLWTTQIPVMDLFSKGLGSNERVTEIVTAIASNKIKFSDSAEYKAALGSYKELFTKGYINKNHAAATYDMAKEAVATGKAAMMMNGEWAVNDITAKWPDAQVALIPMPYNDTQKVLTGKYVEGYAIMKNSSNVENAKKFMNIWLQPKYQNMFYAENSGNPGLKDIDGGKINPAIKEIFDNYLSKGDYLIQMNDDFGAAGGFFDTLWPYYVQIAINSTPDQALKEIDAKFFEFGKAKKLPGF